MNSARSAEKFLNRNKIYQSQMANVSFDVAYKLFWDIQNRFQSRVNNLRFSDGSRQKLVHSFGNILKYCFFNGEKCSSRNFIWLWDPIYGNCYVFNSGFNACGHAINYQESLLPGSHFGLQLLVYVGYNDKFKIFNNGFNS
jgi:hypothetical protein